MAGFLSALNNRGDGYGGPRENRVRLPLEVYRAVRQQVGDDYVVGVRFLGDEVIAGGNRIDDASYFGVEFARAGLDFLSISKGGNLKTRNRRKLARRFTLTRARAATSVCQRCFRMRLGRLDAACRWSLLSSTR